MKGKRTYLKASALALVLSVPVLAAAQAAADAPADARRPRADEATVALYFDPAAGVSADEAVGRALAANGELLAMREEVEAARALVRQARFRANPRLDVSGARAVGMPDNQLMVEGMLPLELGGRRAARVRVAEREVEVREALLADRERVVAAEVRAKFGEALAEVLKLGVTEDLLGNSQRGYRLVVARVLEGRTAPLEQNQVLVEVNRLRSLREASRGKVEVALLELRNLVGAERPRARTCWPPARPRRWPSRASARRAPRAGPTPTCAPATSGCAAATCSAALTRRAASPRLTTRSTPSPSASR
jgi:cobalt-zinc-cadmium efflux system outer membrane protein